MILIDHFNGRAEATHYLARVAGESAISVITRAEVLTGYETRTDSLNAKVELTAIPGPRSHIGDVIVTVRPVEGRRQEIPARALSLVESDR